jgi:hypothetical protein
MNSSAPVETHPDDAVEANSRITGSMGAVLLVALAAEGATVLLHVRGVLSAHVFIGMLLVPPVLVKLGSTGYRIVGYYRGDPRFVARGAPPILLRVLGPFVALTTVAVLATGVAELLIGPSGPLGALHKLSFIAWFAAMTVHVLGHLVETPRLAFADWRRRTRGVPGASSRRLLVVATLVAGALLGCWSLSWIGSAWTHTGRH